MVRAKPGMTLLMLNKVSMSNKVSMLSQVGLQHLETIGE